MKKKNLITAIVVLCLVAVVSVGLTLAYLFSSASITNTFVIGENLSITLSEPDYNEPIDGTKIFPGIEIPKDPTVTLEGEDAFVFMQVTISSELEDLIKPFEIDEDIWEPVQGSVNIYVYKGTGDYRARAGELPPLFTKLQVIDSFDYSTAKTQFENSGEDQTIVVKAAAIQYAGFTLEGASAEVETKWGLI